MWKVGKQRLGIEKCLLGYYIFKQRLPIPRWSLIMTGYRYLQTGMLMLLLRFVDDAFQGELESLREKPEIVEVAHTRKLPLFSSWSLRNEFGIANNSAALFSRKRRKFSACDENPFGTLISDKLKVLYHVSCCMPFTTFVFVEKQFCITITYRVFYHDLLITKLHYIE